MQSENYLECCISTVENQHLKESHEINVSSDAENEQSKNDSSKNAVGMLDLSCSNQASNKLTINRFEEEEYHTSNAIFLQLKNSKLFTIQEINQIINQLDECVSEEMVKEQLNIMSMQTKLLSPVKYFLNGIRKMIDFYEFKAEMMLNKKAN